MWLIRRAIRASPLYILLAYALAIVVFAGLYTLWPRSFHHPYIRFEPAARAQKAALESDLRRAIVAEFERRPKLSDTVSYRNLARVEILGEQDSRLLGAAEMMVEFTATENRLFVLKVPLLIFAFDAAMLADQPGTPVPIYVTADPNRQVEDESLPPHPSDARQQVANVVTHAIERVQLDKREAALAASVVCTEQGITCGTLGNFGRMLYFSATTITTVGYGDVVPLSGIARFLAALEATVGVVLLGLFVVSLGAARSDAAKADR